LCKDYPVSVFEDNDGAIKIAKKVVSGGRTKHIDTRYHYVRQLEREGKIEIGYLQTEFQHADPFTKGLSKKSFNRYSSVIMRRMKWN
ncbi:unnamed protein product, partial [Choristocarpus tenellus]